MLALRSRDCSLAAGSKEARGRQSSLTRDGNQEDTSAYKHVSAITESVILSSLQSQSPPPCF